MIKYILACCPRVATSDAKNRLIFNCVLLYNYKQQCLTKFIKVIDSWKRLIIAINQSTNTKIPIRFSDFFSRTIAQGGLQYIIFVIIGLLEIPWDRLRSLISGLGFFAKESYTSACETLLLKTSKCCNMLILEQKKLFSKLLIYGSLKYLIDYDQFKCSWVLQNSKCMQK